MLVSNEYYSGDRTDNKVLIWIPGVRREALEFTSTLKIKTNTALCLGLLNIGSDRRSRSHNLKSIIILASDN